MIQWMYEANNFIGTTLMITSALFTALLTEIIFKDKERVQMDRTSVLPLLNHIYCSQQPLQQLEPQEQMTLHYYIQLILASSHFEYAKEFRKHSDQWETHMKLAETECAAFEQSSKSFFYIEEKFQLLKDNINWEKGELSEKPNQRINIPL